MKACDVIYRLRPNKTNYFTILKSPDNDYKLYGCDWHRYFRAIRLDSKDGLVFGNKEIIMKSGACHNLYPFVADGKLYALGGIDAWKHNEKWHTIKDFNTFKKMFKDRFNEDYSKDEKRFQGFKDSISNTVCLQHCDGIYLFEDDGGVFKEVYDKPVIKADHKGFVSALDWGKSSEFDSHMSIVKKDGLYYIFLRKNRIRWERSIQYATSPDLKNWSEFKSINIQGYDINWDSYYSPIFMEHPFEKGIYLGFIPYWRAEMIRDKNGKPSYDEMDYTSIRILRSSNLIDWKVTNNIFKDDFSYIGDQPKNPRHFVNGLLQREKGFIEFFIHENYLGLVPGDVYIRRYKVTYKEFNEMVKC